MNSEQPSTVLYNKSSAHPDAKIRLLNCSSIDAQSSVPLTVALYQTKLADALKSDGVVFRLLLPLLISCVIQQLFQKLYCYALFLHELMIEKQTAFNTRIIGGKSFSLDIYGSKQRRHRCLREDDFATFGDGNSGFNNDLSVFCERFCGVRPAALVIDQTSHKIEGLKHQIMLNL